MLTVRFVKFRTLQWRGVTSSLILLKRVMRRHIHRFINVTFMCCWVNFKFCCSHDLTFLLLHQVSQMYMVAPLDLHFSILYNVLKKHITEDADYKVSYLNFLLFFEQVTLPDQLIYWGFVHVCPIQFFRWLYSVLLQWSPNLLLKFFSSWNWI